MMAKAGVEDNAQSALSWMEANRRYVWSHLSWLRLVLRRRVLWLRSRWREDSLKNHRGELVSDAQTDRLLEGEAFSAERRFYEEDHAARELTREIEEAAERLEERSGEMFESGAPAALDTLVRLFGLNRHDTSVLILCLAPELDGGFERLYGYVQDNLTANFATPGLAFSLFRGREGGDTLLRQSLLPEAPLINFRLVRRDVSAQSMNEGLSSPLRIDRRVADYILGINRLDERVGEVIRAVPAAGPLPPTYGEIADKLRRYLERGVGRGRHHLFNLTGPAAAGKRDIASRLCRELGLELFALDLRALRSSDVRLRGLAHTMERECLLLPAALYIDTSGLSDENDPLRPALEALIERFGPFFIVGSAEPWATDREVFVQPVPKLDRKEQMGLWEQRLAGGGVRLDGHLEKVVEQFDLETDMIDKGIAMARITAGMRDGREAEPGFDDLWSACRELTRRGLDGLAQSIAPCYDWEDIVLPQSCLEQLKDIASQVANRSVVYERWGFGEKLNRGRGIGVLFSGPSGTGKTMAAEVLANHLKLDLYRIDLSAVVSKYIGETEKNLRRVFDAAEQCGAILFFDEADALFGKRSEVKDSHDRYANIEVNYLLQRMEEYRGLAILATNMRSLLDQAFLRRLRFQVDFPFPDASYRLSIWRKAFPSRATVGELDHDFLARLEIPGGNIKNIALNAAFMAARDGMSIEMRHIMRATKREYDKIGKLLLESEFGHYHSQVVKL